MIMCPSGQTIYVLGSGAYCNETSVIFLKILPKISHSKLQGQINYFVHLSGHLTFFSKNWQQKYSTPAPPKEKINKWWYLLDNIILAWKFTEINVIC
jgi:uncharacterized membrane-anchored protein